MTTELFHVPISVWALIVALFSFLTALTALGWQVLKHFLDGGRVKVYLNAAIWQPEYMLVTNRSGRLLLKNDDSAKEVVRGEALELAQLVVENPGRVPVTIYSPGLAFSGHGRRKHSVVPRMFATGDSMGPDKSIKETMVRLEPYDRVTFLFDYWSGMPGLLKDAPDGHVVVRGYVGVAGRTNRPQKSRWSRRWRIGRGMYTAIEGSPDLTPLAVLWREMYVGLPDDEEEEQQRHPQAGTPITRGSASHILNIAMSRFDQRPERDDLKDVVDEIAQEYGDRFPRLGFRLWEGYQALDRMEGHLTEWKEGLLGGQSEKAQNTDTGNASEDGKEAPDGSQERNTEPGRTSDV